MGYLACPRYVTLDQFQRAYQETQQGRSQALLIEGEPGIGKARLAEEFLAAAAAGATTLASLLHLRDLDEISNQTHLVPTGGALKKLRSIPSSFLLTSCNGPLFPASPGCTQAATTSAPQTSTSTRL